MFRQYINTIENKYKSIFEIPEENTKKKEKEKFDECSHYIQTIEKIIIDNVHKKEELTRCNLDEKKMKQLKFEQFELCVQYREVQKLLKNHLKK